MTRPSPSISSRRRHDEAEPAGVTREQAYERSRTQCEKWSLEVQVGTLESRWSPVSIKGGRMAHLKPTPLCWRVQLRRRVRFHRGNGRLRWALVHRMTALSCGTVSEQEFSSGLHLLPSLPQNHHNHRECMQGNSPANDSNGGSMTHL